MPKRFPKDILRNVLRAKPKRHLEGWWSIVRFPLTCGLPKVRRGTCLVEYDYSIHHQSFPRECSIQPFPVNYDRIYKKYQQLVHNRCARCNLCNVYNVDIVDSLDFWLLKQSGTRLNSIEAISKTWPNPILNMSLRDASASKKAKKLLRNLL